MKIGKSKNTSPIFREPKKACPTTVKSVPVLMSQYRLAPFHRLAGSIGLTRMKRLSQQCTINIVKGNIVKGNSVKGNIVKGNIVKGNIVKSFLPQDRLSIGRQRPTESIGPSTELVL
jgi:hypothetical protein